MNDELKVEAVPFIVHRSDFRVSFSSLRPAFLILAARGATL